MAAVAAGGRGWGGQCGCGGEGGLGGSPPPRRILTPTGLLILGSRFGRPGVQAFVNRMGPHHRTSTSMPSKGGRMR